VSPQSLSPSRPVTTQGGPDRKTLSQVASKMIQVMKVTNGTFNSKGSEPEAEESLVQEAKRLEEKYALSYSRQTSASLETLTLIRAVIEEQKDQAAVQRRLKLEEREREKKEAKYRRFMEKMEKNWLAGDLN